MLLTFNLIRSLTFKPSIYTITHWMDIISIAHCDGMYSSASITDRARMGIIFDWHVTGVPQNHTDCPSILCHNSSAAYSISLFKLITERKFLELSQLTYGASIIHIILHFNLQPTTYHIQQYSYSCYS